MGFRNLEYVNGYYGTTKPLRLYPKSKQPWMPGFDKREYSRLSRQVFGANKRAIEKGLEGTLRVKDLEWPKFCPILGIELSYSNDSIQDNSPSIDRIDPTKGYTKENCHVISMRANRIKYNATVEEIEAVASYFRKLKDGSE